MTHLELLYGPRTSVGTFINNISRPHLNQLLINLVPKSALNILACSGGLSRPSPGRKLPVDRLRTFHSEALPRSDIPPCVPVNQEETLFISQLAYLIPRIPHESAKQVPATT